MADPKTQLLTVPLTLGMNNAAFEEAVSPIGDRPELIASVNTRLSKMRGVAAKAPGATELLTGAPRCGGIVPCGAYDSSVAFFHPGGGGNRRISGDLVETLRPQRISGQQSAYYPAQVARAGALPAGAATYQNAAICRDIGSGYTYFATYRVVTVGSGTSVFVTVIDDDGRLVVTPTQAVSTFADVAVGEGSFVGLTAHAPGVVLLWYRDGSVGLGATVLKCRTLTVTSLGLVIGAPSTIYTPSSAKPRSIALACDPNDQASAYLVCFDAVGTNARLIRVDVATRTVAVSFGVATGGDANTFHSISYVHDGTSGYLVWMASWAAGNCSVYRANTSSLATLWSATNRMWNSAAVSCGFYRANGAHYAVYVASSDGNVTSTGNPAGLKFEFRDIAAGALAYSGDVPWYQHVTQCATQKILDTEYYPLIAIQTIWNTAQHYNPALAGFLPDPSIEVARPAITDAGVSWSVVGHLGADFCTRAVDYGLGGCNSLLCQGTNVWLAYKAENLADGMITTEWVSRYVRMDFGQVCPRYALSRDGTAVVAAAMPAVWDGSDITEFSPLRAPKIYGQAAGGVGVNLTGTFLFAAVVSWKDGQGRWHPSAPSNVLSLAPAGSKVQLWVTAPLSYRNGDALPRYRVTIYASEASGTVLYAQSYTEQFAGSTAYWLSFSDVGTPVIDASHPALYSDGSATQMKLPFCPNACVDAAVIGDRLWMLDAERGRAYYSQPATTEALQAFWFAMNPTQYVDFPASAGAPVAVSQWRGRPVFFTQFGIWTVDGSGPDALNNPPFFSEPTQLSELNCTDRGSVVSTPAGVMFVTGKRFAAFAGEARLFDQIQVDNAIAGSAVFRGQQEVVFVDASGVAHVYNYVEQKWTRWDTTAMGGGNSLTCAAQSSNGKLLYFSRANSSIVVLDPDTVSVTAQMLLRTGWFTLGGPQDDNRLINVIMHAVRVGSHGVTITIATDYKSSQPSKVMSVADVLSATSNLRYDAWLEPRDQAARAVQITVQETDAAGEAFLPLHLTLEILKNPGKLAASLKQSGRK